MDKVVGYCRHKVAVIRDDPHTEAYDALVRAQERLRKNVGTMSENQSRLEVARCEERLERLS